MSDIDTIRINFTEEFRRTKRNVLFWSSATIILVAGTLASDVPIETSWAQNIKLPPVFLIFCSWTVMIYMIVDFWHANHRLKIDNGALKATISVNNTAKESSELARRLRLLLPPLEQAVSQVLTEARTSTDNSSAPTIVRVEESLTKVREGFDNLCNLSKRVEDYAESVDKRDKLVRCIY